MGFAKAADGFYTATPNGVWQDGYRTGPPASTTTMIIYVSSSTGKDSGDGGFVANIEGSLAQPYRTISAGYARIRNGSPDWLLLARGDTWLNQNIPGDLSQGMNATNRFILGSYERSLPNNPPVPNPAVPGIQPLWKPPLNVPPLVNLVANIAVLGIDFYCHTRDPSSGTYTPSNEQDTTGVWFRGGTQIVEDCCFRFFQNCIETEGGGLDGTPVGDSGQFQEIRRCRLVDSWNLSPTGIVSAGLGGGGKGSHTLVEESFIDSNGWNATVDPQGSPLNHNYYQNASNTLDPNWGFGGNPGGHNNFWKYTTTHGNVVARDGPFTDCQLRTGGWLNNNLFLINGTSGSGHGASNASATNIVENNVGFDLTGVPGRANAIIGLSGSFVDGHPNYYGLYVPGMQPIPVRNNIAIKAVSGGSEAAMFGAGGDNNVGVLYHIQNNISWVFAYNNNIQPGGKIIDDRFGGQGGYTLSGYNIITATNTFGWLDPGRTVGKYLDHILGGSGHNEASYYALCRAQHRGNWNPLLMADSVNDYVREGFNLPFVGSAYAGGNIPTIITISPASLPSGTMGVAYNQTFSASGGTPPYTFAVVFGTLPNGLTLTSAGLLSGSPTTAGTFNFTVRATDSVATTADASYSVTIILNFHRVALTMTAA